MPKILADIAIDPIGTGTTSESDFISGSEEVLQGYGDGLRYQINPMSTTLEGERSTVLSAIDAMLGAPFATGAKRIVATIRIDDRRDAELNLEHSTDIIYQKARI